MASRQLRRLSRLTISQCLLSASCLMLAGCADSSPGIVEIRSVGAYTMMHSRLGRPANVRSGERLFAELADAAPSSAGFYYDSTGALVVRVRDRGDAAAALAAVGQLISTQFPRGMIGGLQVRGVRIAHAEFTFHELAEWRDLAFENVLGSVPGAVTLDLDESQNRVMVGVDEAMFEESRANIVRALGARGVDTTALQFKSVKVVNGSPLQDLTAPATLQSEATGSLAGGLMITFENYSYACTLGFVAERNGVLGFVTASHCSSSMFQLDGTAYNQGYNLVATETVDPSGSSCNLVESCRHSDANFAAAANGYPMSVGKILRTIGVNTGSLTVDPNQPYFDVVEQGSNLVQGQPVDKVGERTGWTSGSILGTCEDAAFDGKRVQCTYTSNFGGDHGDSGSPVFFRLLSGNESEVDLIGVFFAMSYEGVKYFSKLESIESDLGGTWNVIAHAPTPSTDPPYIEGPDDVSSDPSCSNRYTLHYDNASSWSTDGTITSVSGNDVWISWTTQEGGHWVTALDADGQQIAGLSDIISSSFGMWCHYPS